MRKEAKLLREKAVESLILSIEVFNRPLDSGRTHGVLIFMDHAFEMLLKAAILHRGGKIREPRAKLTIGFESCVRKALTDGRIKFLNEEQALIAQMINSLRDAAQHHLLDISEPHLYIQAQAGLTLFRDIFESVFEDDLRGYLPERVLPLSTSSPCDLTTIFDTETEEIRKLLVPGSRRRTEAEAKLRSLSIVEKAMNGEKSQPSASELNQLASGLIAENNSWEDVFPGVATITLTANGYGPSIDLRISKTGTPVQIVPEGTEGASVVAIKRVNELDFYSLSRDQLAKKVNLSGPKTTAVIRFLNLQEKSDCFKKVAIGRSTFDRYSQKAIDEILKELKITPIEEIWSSHGIRWKRREDVDAQE